MGIGAKDYKVSVSYDDGKKPKQPKTETKKPAMTPAQKKKPAPKKAVEKKEAAVKTEQKREYPESVDLEYAKSYLNTILEDLKLTSLRLRLHTQKAL